jgi:hypothetical protein
MNLRLPPSLAFCASTACAVVPEPAKESRINASGFGTSSTSLWISPTGFGKSNGFVPITSVKVFLARSMFKSASSQIVFGLVVASAPSAPTK